MSLPGKVKTALDETRTLILGAQVLLGFQFQGAFQQRFEHLPRTDRLLHAAALGLLAVAVALLMAPSSYHRIAEHGQSSGRMQLITSRLAALALVPFVTGLGLDLTVTLGQMWGDGVWSATGGAMFTAAGLGSWFGLGKAMRRRQGVAERDKARRERGETEVPPLHARIEQMLTETRVVLPGAQALLGFQLTIVLTDAFEKLPESSKLMHGGALLCIALCVILLMTPAALHRIVWAGEDSEAALRIGGRLTVLALVPLGLGLSTDSYVVLARITESAGAAGAAAIALLLVLLGLWFVWPFAARAPASVPVGAAK